MPTLFDVDPSELITAVAEELKKIDAIKAPVWASIVKTGAGKERPPVEKDWWYARAASVLRATKLKGPIGVSKLRTKYSNKKNRGVAPSKHYRASGNILRKILQQLEKAELIKKEEKGVHKGRIATGKGSSLLDKTATKIIAGRPKKQEVKEEPKTPAPKEQKPAPKQDAPVQIKEKKPITNEKPPVKPEIKAPENKTIPEVKK